MSERGERVEITSTDLFDCPFCGGKAEMVWDKKYDPPDCGGARTPEWDAWYVQCTSCGVVPNGWGNLDWSSEESAAKAWNRRPSND